MCAILLCAILLCVVLLCAEREERAMWRDGGERRAYGRSKKQAALTGGLFVSVIGVFIGGNFLGSAEMAQRCLAMSGFAQCRPLCEAVLRCFLSGATPANGQISIALALEQAALRWLLSRRYRVGSRTLHFVFFAYAGRLNTALAGANARSSLPFWRRGKSCIQRSNAVSLPHLHKASTAMSASG